MTDKKTEALKLAQAFICWIQFGECRTEHHEGPIPTAAQVDAALREALAEQPAQQPDQISELHGALEDLVEAVCAVPDASWPDGFRWVSVRHAKDALARKPAPQPAQQEPVAVPTTSYEHRKFVIVGRDWYERFAAFHDDCQIGEQLTWQEKTIRQQGYENGWNDAQRYLKEPRSTSPTPAQQEPVAWMDGYRNIYSLEEKAAGCAEATIALVPMANQEKTSGSPINELQCVCGAVWLGEEMVHLPDKRPPAQRTWVGLTDEQWQSIADTLGCFITRGQKDAIEATIGIKGDA